MLVKASGVLVLVLGLFIQHAAAKYMCRMAMQGVDCGNKYAHTALAGEEIMDCQTECFDVAAAATAKFKGEGKTCKVNAECTCFPADATVVLHDGTTKTLAEVAIGDRVLAGGGRFSEVYFFSHRLADAEASFVELTTASGATLALTGGHYLPINGGGRLAEARTVKLGDNVTLANGKPDAVVAIAASVRKRGLYNPHTLQGDIVVDGVLASTYTAAFAPALAHALLAPLRALRRAGVDVVKADVGAALDALPVWWTSRFREEVND